MRRIALTVCLVLGALTAVAVPAQAAAGQVVVFVNEFTPLAIYNDPQGCHNLPPLAHVLDNQTDQPVRHYALPDCTGPSLTIAPGYGSHVQGFGGSFSV